jgi:hypothetical protein
MQLARHFLIFALTRSGDGQQQQKLAGYKQQKDTEYPTAHPCHVQHHYGKNFSDGSLL